MTRLFPDRARWLLAAAGLVVACAHSTDEIVEDNPDLTQENGATESTGAKTGSAGHGGGGGSARAGTGGGGGKAGAGGTSAGGSGGLKSSGGTKSGGGSAGTAGGGTGGTGGAGGASGGSGGTSSAGSGGSVGAGTLELDYKAGNVDPADNQIRMGLRIKSTTAAPIALSSLELRYYFTSEVALPLVIELYDASVANGTASYHAVSHDAVKTTVEGASSYLSVTFANEAGALAMGDALTLDIAVHGQNWTGNFTETNDYSFAADHTDFTPWDHVTVFGPSLIWGKEPM